MKRNRILSFPVITVLAVIGLSACQDEFDLTDNVIPYSVKGSPFTRAVADTMTITDFRRSYGVGFGYDGIWGEKCNLKDVHSAVLDLRAIREWEKEDWHSKLFYSMSEKEFTYTVRTAYSHSEFVQKIVAQADVNAKLIVFNGSVSGALTAWEGGQKNDFFCSVKYCSPCLQMTLSDGNLRSLLKRGHTDLLTQNFRDAIDWMDKHPGDAVIDSFLVCYGSHVVTRAKVGGSWDILMNMKRDSLIDIDSKNILGDAVIKGLLKTDVQSEETRKVMHMLNSADCNITVKGGDLSVIPNQLLHFSFGQCPNLSEYIGKWAATLNFSPEEYANNNLEITDMEVMPIWDFIPNSDVAKRVRLRVEGTADELIRDAGYQNFTNTSFRIPENVTCKMGDRSVTFSNPDICNVIASGCYVAAVCRERIDLPGIGISDVQVVYPIYNQQINLSCGYTVFDDAGYRIRWQNNTCRVEKDTLETPQPDGTIYMTYGVPGSVKYANINYQPSHTVIGYEWPMSITYTGKIDNSKPYYLTYKSGTEFLLRSTDGQEQKGNLNGLPNWSFKNGRMVRNKEYYYYWNPNEVNY